MLQVERNRESHRKESAAQGELKGVGGRGRAGCLLRSIFACVAGYSRHSRWAKSLNPKLCHHRSLQGDVHVRCESTEDSHCSWHNGSVCV